MEWLHGNEDDVAAGIALAEQTLVYDPYNVAMHRELAAAGARAGDVERVYEHLSVCFDMGADTIESLHLSKSALEEIVARIEEECRSRTRFKDVRFDEIAPRTRAFVTTLVWKDEDHGAVAAAFQRLAEAAARQAVAGGRYPDLEQAMVWYDFEERLQSPFELDERLIADPCSFGTVHQFLRDLAPYVDDVRFLMFDQVSAIDEVWILDGAFHVCRHPLYDSGAAERARFFEELTLDDALRKYVAQCWRTVAHVSLEANENRRSHADGTGAEAEHAIHRIIALGGEAEFLQARLALFRRDFAAATHYLERTIEAAPSRRDAIVMLARRRVDDGRWEETIDLVERAMAISPGYHDDCHLLRAIALESLSRVREAKVAYQRHVKMHPNARLLADAAALLERGLHASACLLYESLRPAASDDGLAAELGLARCATTTQQLETARAHYERVLERGPALRTANAGNTRLISAIERHELEARTRLSELR